MTRVNTWDHFPMFDVERQKATVKERAASFYLVLTVNSGSGSALLLLNASKMCVAKQEPIQQKSIVVFFFFISLLFNPLFGSCPPPHVNRCCRSCKDTISPPFLSCLTRKQTKGMLVFFFVQLICKYKQTSNNKYKQSKWFPRSEKK